MGIRGLTTYINGKSRFFEPYELHGGYLVIDAFSLMCQLYLGSKCNCAFGGDHDTFAHTVSEFFDDLAKCEVTPLVIFDGGREQKKKKTSELRMREKFQSAKHYNPSSQEKFMPTTLILSYMDVLLKKSIKMCRAVFEADADIAGVAKALNCPVLSNDSDFYLFGVLYIPMSSLDPFIVKQKNSYVKRCCIYRVENLLRSFPGLDATVFTLIAILLGNDYIRGGVLKAFFGSLKILQQNQRLYNEQQRKIHTTLHWLKNYNLNDAVAAILSKLRKKRRRRALYMIELVINGYIETPCRLLVPLGFENLYREHMNRRQCRKLFKFKGDIDTLESSQLWRDAAISTDENLGREDEDLNENSENSSSDQETEEETCETGKTYYNTNIEETWPSWFSERYSKGEFPSYFVDIMNLRQFNASTQIEDFNYPSPSFTSLEIMRVIDGLLLSGRSDQVPGLLYLTRDGENSNRCRLEEILTGTQSVKFPTLAELGATKMDIKKRIIDDTLGITGKESLFEDLPAKWRLYVATIFFWMKSDQEPARNSCHINAILLAMLIGVIDQKIGYHRSQRSFNKAFERKITEILAKRKISKSASPASALAEESSVIEAVDSVNEEDCLIAAPFFISHRLPDQKLVASPHKFDSTIVHVFAQFQACLGAAIQLNSLLGYPYEHSNISECYNGTMLYNLYTNFEKRSDVEAYIFVTLENSPSLSKLMKLLFTKIKNILEDVPVTTGNKATKRRRNKKKKKEISDDEKMICEDENDAFDVQTHFHDPSNLFSVLGTATQ
ncbi:protein asteroid-like [Venturia canescens]|uniref:protein asteroid-like n=1 Tax=Venturia canescens TaxID=32260 RepID=UPI001C9D4621|nr:protein asteroid-like [Venturia canescens]